MTATDERVVQVEERQIAAGQGPCHDAYVSRDRVTCADLAAEDRWPGYTPVALDQGYRAVVGIPMAVEDGRVGALNIYSHAPREWPADDLDIAQVLADMVTGYIMNARALSEAEQLAGRLRHALDSRVVVEQAKGIVAERHGSDPAAAFETIRRHARSHNLRVHDVARDIVDGSLRL